MPIFQTLEETFPDIETFGPTFSKHWKPGAERGGLGAPRGSSSEAVVKNSSRRRDRYATRSASSSSICSTCDGQAEPARRSGSTFLDRRSLRRRLVSIFAARLFQPLEPICANLRNLSKTPRLRGG